MKKQESYLEEAIKNVRDDRQVTVSLLEDIIKYLAKNEEHHKYAGPVAAKYVETLQRSNEQLVKISTLIHKKDSSDTGLSDLDKATIFDLLQEETKDGG